MNLYLMGYFFLNYYEMYDLLWIFFYYMFLNLIKYFVYYMREYLVYIKWKNGFCEKEVIEYFELFLIWDIMLYLLILESIFVD